MRARASPKKTGEILSKLLLINNYRRKINVKKPAQNGGRKDIL